MGRFKEIREIRIDQLVVSDQQARTRGVETDLDDLVENIRIHDQLEPIVVAPLDADHTRFEIVAGQRRFLALQRLGRQTILAGILSGRIEEGSARILSISENLLRRDLDSKDLIDACTDLYRKYGSIKAVSQEFGLPYNKVRSYVKYERLRQELKEHIGAGTLSIRTAIRIEDHLGDARVSGEELGTIIQKVSAMTQAQQADYFRTSGPPGVSGGEGTSQRTSRREAGRVRQIVVTLREEQYNLLRSWAARKSLTQDRAAAKIIGEFLGTVRPTLPSS